MSIKEKGHYTPSKWEFIADECPKLGYDGSEGLAREIEVALLDLYGETVTDEWADEYEGLIADDVEVTGDDLAMIACCTGFCIACDRTSSGLCYDCDFGNKHGMCKAHGSLFSDFYETLKIERSKNIVIKEVIHERNFSKETT